MTPQDIEKLKAFCDEKGIEMIPTSDRDVWEFKSKDIWDGVEFIERPTCQGKYEKICKVEEILTDMIAYRCSRQGRVAGYKSELKPSTESAYVEQLKAKAKELYGEIKEGDIFEAEWCFNGGASIVSPKRVHYHKELDSLFIDGFSIYQQGKWAKRVEEPIKANITSFTLSNPYSTIVFTTSHRIKDGQVDAKEFMNHIEESIEAFLNRKP